MLMFQNKNVSMFPERFAKTNVLILGGAKNAMEAILEPLEAILEPLEEILEPMKAILEPLGFLLSMPGKPMDMT